MKVYSGAVGWALALVVLSAPVAEAVVLDSDAASGRVAISGHIAPDDYADLRFVARDGTREPVTLAWMLTCGTASSFGRTSRPEKVVAPVTGDGDCTYRATARASSRVVLKLRGILIRAG